jgi:hypothetical protein
MQKKHPQLRRQIEIEFGSMQSPIQNTFTLWVSIFPLQSFWSSMPTFSLCLYSLVSLFITKKFYTWCPPLTLINIGALMYSGVNYLGSWANTCCTLTVIGIGAHPCVCSLHVLWSTMHSCAMDYP